MKIRYLFDKDGDETIFEITYMEELKIAMDFLISEGIAPTDENVECFLNEYKDVVYEVAKEKFYDEAYETYLDQLEYEKDPYAYYGLSRKDFL